MVQYNLMYVESATRHTCMPCENKNVIKICHCLAATPFCFYYTNLLRCILYISATNAPC